MMNSRRAGKQLCLLLLALLFSQFALALTFTVNNNGDTRDANTGNSVCADSSGNCTLRAAIEEANASSGSDTVNVPSILGTITLTLDDDLDVSGTLTITGTGASRSVVDGNGDERVINMQSGATLTINNLIIQNGDAGGNDGGGILNEGTLTLNNVVLRNNEADEGGGLYSRQNGVAVSVTDSSFENNTAANDGGGAYVRDSQATFNRVTFVGNSTGGNDDGGGIYTRSNTTTITNVTFSQNSADEGGGLFVHDGNTTVTHATFYRNTAGDKGDNMRRRDGTLIVRNTIADNNGNGDNCDGTITAQGTNLAYGTGCGFSTNGNPALGALTNNGGSTNTHAITSGSPADGIASTYCASEDQRTISRTAPCDVGAFEVGSGPVSGEDLSLTLSDDVDPATLTSLITYMITVDNNGTVDASAVMVTDNLPAAATYIAVTPSQGTCVHSGGNPGGTLTCSLGDILSGDSATIEMIVRAPAYGIGGGLNNTASVTPMSGETNTSNNSATENTQLISNAARLCYVVADGGNILIEFDTAGTETVVGSTVASDIEAIAYHAASGILYATDNGRFGWLNLTTGAFNFIGNIGQADGDQGSILLDNVDGLAYDATTGIMYGAHARSGNDLLFQINVTTGAFVPDAFGPGDDYVDIQQIAGNSITDDIAVDPTTGIMYASVNSGGGTDRLIVINKTNGATTDIALITVPDIEGLGTDFSGQLWGTSGTQGIMYQIDKASGVGSNGVNITNGTDHEAVDCFAVSPTIRVDIGVTKAVDDATPNEGDSVVFTLGVSNSGPANATALQISDALPAGLTFSSASASQGIYDAASGNWHIGGLNVGAAVSLTITATVDSGTSGSTITNTASVAFVSQGDVNSANDSASVDVIPTGGASLLVLKSSRTVRDPLGAVAPAALAIPQAVVEYEISISNSGTGSATDVVVTDALASSLQFLPAEYDTGSGNADIEITIGTATPVFCIAEIGGDSNSDGCFLDAGGDDLTVSIPVSLAYPNGLTVGATAPNNVSVIRFRATVQ